MKKYTNAIEERTISLSPAQVMSGAHDADQLGTNELLKRIFTIGYVDDHDHINGVKNPKPYTPEVVVLRFDLRNGATEVCAAFENTAFCVNPFYYNSDDDMIHLSTCSVGGSLNVRIEGSLEEAVNKYNREQLAAFGSEQLIVVKKKHFMVGLNSREELAQSMRKSA